MQDEEAMALATATAHCCQAFDVRVDPRMLAIGELAGVMSTIYLRRLFVLRMRKEQPQIHPVEPQATTVN